MFVGIVRFVGFVCESPCGIYSVTCALDGWACGLVKESGRFEGEAVGLQFGFRA